jgi:hypothetical protein
MKVLTASGGRLLVEDDPNTSIRFQPPSSGLAGGVHELLFEPATACEPWYAAASFIARGANVGSGVAAGAAPVVWCQSARSFYPPALMASLGIPARRVYVVAPPRTADVTWAAAECMRCPGVGAVVAAVPSRLTRVEARRLQLAAERGKTLGVLLRPTGPGDDVYAAVTRWLVSPARGEPTVQRWRVELIHGHGRHAYRSFTLERRHGAVAPVVVPVGEPAVAPAPLVVRSPHALAGRPPTAPRAAAVG